VLDKHSTDESSYHISSFSGGGECVAVARSRSGDYLVRHSRDDVPPILFTPAEWKSFIAGVKVGEFDF
jgi:Domain of unknown function (DUF397)